MRLEQTHQGNTSNVFYKVDITNVKLDNKLMPDENEWKEYPNELGVLLQKKIQTNKVVGQQDLWISEPEFSAWVPPCSFISSIIDDTSKLIHQETMGNPKRPGFKLSSRELAENPELHFNLSDTNFEWLVYEDGDIETDRTLKIPGINNLNISGWVAHPEYETNLLHEIEAGTGVSGLATGIDSSSLNSIRFCMNKYIGQLAQTRNGGHDRHEFNVVSFHAQITNEINQAIDRFNSLDSSTQNQDTSSTISSLYNLR